MSVCEKVISPADLGDYELYVTRDGSSDTVHGIHGLNGAEVDEWTHEDLVVHGPQRFTINVGERHVVLVFGTFNNDDTFTVELKHGGAVVATCVLTKDGHTSSSMSVLAAEEG